MKKLVTTLAVAAFMLSLVGSSLAQTITMDNESSNINQNTIVVPGTGSQSGSTSGAGATVIPKNPRSWMNPMILPSVTSPVFNNTPTQWSRMRTDLGLIFMFKKHWYELELKEYAKRPGKVNVSFTFLPAGTVAPEYSLQVEELSFAVNDPDAFRRSYEFCGDVSIDGYEGADSQKLWGTCGEIARSNGAALFIPINSGGTFKLDEKTIQKIFGISMGAQSGGTGSATGIMLGFSKGTATHESEVKTLPFFVGLCFKKTGVPYRPTVRKVAKAQPAPAAAPQAEVTGVPDANAPGFQRKQVKPGEVQEYQQRR